MDLFASSDDGRTTLSVKGGPQNVNMKIDFNRALALWGPCPSLHVKLDIAADTLEVQDSLGGANEVVLTACRPGDPTSNLYIVMTPDSVLALAEMVPELVRSAEAKKAAALVKAQ